ncbi:BolA family protein [Halomonas halocynthiae]|uniref:BolA family protein n=1 Tax=Halomonas halocynthiae TaxID=176290 RepID=UPI0004233A85|nr:BolA/IbaG family iron-sulfur metabolism protein [Halomonas halocynthiae]
MQPTDVKALLESRIEGCDFLIKGEGCDFQVIAIGDVFDELSRIKSQQLILGALSDEIASGALHAITVRTYTPLKWQDAPENTSQMNPGA